MTRPTTVLHGIDQAGLSSKRPAMIHDGHLFYERDTGCVRIGDAGDDNADPEWRPFVLLGFEFDVDEDGGEVGPIGLARARVPAGTIIVGGCIDVLETFTSANDSATIAISIESANDIVSAIAISNGGNPWDAGLHAVVPVWSDPTKWIKATKDRDVRITVGTQDLTAGKLRGFLVCLPSEVAGGVTEEESSSSSASSDSSSSESSSSST